MFLSVLSLLLLLTVLVMLVLLLFFVLLVLLVSTVAVGSFITDRIDYLLALLATLRCGVGNVY